MINSIKTNADALYLHVPFCSSICHYCDFKKNIYHNDKANIWLQDIKKQLDNEVLNYNLKTIYIGGGTPTSLTYKQLDILLGYLKPYSHNVLEYTIESNIENINIELINILNKYNINRISLGVQSLDNNLLKFMNRKHTKEDIFNKLELLNNNGINNISIDLIYGFKELTLDMFKEHLLLLTSISAIKHISLYSLTIENNTYFNRIKYETISDIQEANFYILAKQILEKNNFRQYEVANYAREGYESIHNKYYWRYENFYGIGIGSSGKLGNIRYTKKNNDIDYIILDNDDMIFEHIMMNLRLVCGINIINFNNKYNINLINEYKDIIDNYIKDNMLIVDNNYLKATPKGLLNLNDILVSFLR